MPNDTKTDSVNTSESKQGSESRSKRTFTRRQAIIATVGGLAAVAGSVGFAVWSNSNKPSQPTDVGGITNVPTANKDKVDYKSIRDNRLSEHTDQNVINEDTGVFHDVPFDKKLDRIPDLCAWVLAYDNHFPHSNTNDNKGAMIDWLDRNYNLTVDDSNGKIDAIYKPVSGTQAGSMPVVFCGGATTYKTDDPLVYNIEAIVLSSKIAYDPIHENAGDVYNNDAIPQFKQAWAQNYTEFIDKYKKIVKMTLVIDANNNAHATIKVNDDQADWIEG